MLRLASIRDARRPALILVVVLGITAILAWQLRLQSDLGAPREESLAVDTPRPPSIANNEDEAAFDRILVSMPLDRVAELLRAAENSPTGDAVPGWGDIPREECIGFRRIFVPHPLNYSARTLARTCDLNPDDVPLTSEQMAELEALFECFLPPFREADDLLMRVRSAEVDAALAAGRARHMGELPTATADERDRVERSVEAMMVRETERLKAMGLPYDAEWVRRTLREPWARRLDADGSNRWSMTVLRDGDAHIVSIDAMPRSRVVWDLKLHISHTFARSIVSWFEHRGFLDATRAAPVEAEIDRVYRLARRQLGLE
ncbi:MAG: hypothetical protein AB7T19_05955 [Planctomycetota bacterium]